MATKVLHNKGERKIVHAKGEILPKATVRLDAEAADYLHALFPGELVNPHDETKIFDQSTDQSTPVVAEPLAPVGEDEVEAEELTEAEVEADAFESELTVSEVVVDAPKKRGRKAAE